MEKPYIWYKKLSPGIRVGWKAIVYAAVVPYLLYQMILFFVRYDHKVKNEIIKNIKLFMKI